MEKWFFCKFVVSKIDIKLSKGIKGNWEGENV